MFAVKITNKLRINGSIHPRCPDKRKRVQYRLHPHQPQIKNGLYKNVDVGTQIACQKGRNHRPHGSCQLLHENQIIHSETERFEY
jgi:hypothetical protein